MIQKSVILETRKTVRKIVNIPLKINSFISIIQTDHLRRHYMRANIIHEKLAFLCNLEISQEESLQYTPQSVLENTQLRLYWYIQIITDRSVANNRPD